MFGGQVDRSDLGGIELQRRAAGAGEPRPGGLAGGIDPVGVVATNRFEEILELRPDVVLYLPLHWQVDDMVRLLEAGINVISTANFITGRRSAVQPGGGTHAALAAPGVARGLSCRGRSARPRMTLCGR